MARKVQQKPAQETAPLHPLIVAVVTAVVTASAICKPCDGAGGATSIMNDLGIDFGKRHYVKDQATIPTILRGDSKCVLTDGLVEADLIAHSKRKGEMWAKVLQSALSAYDPATPVGSQWSNSNDVIIEVGSGYFPKAGLAAANFTGTYILVEPNDEAIRNVVCIHAHGKQAKSPPPPPVLS